MKFKKKNLLVLLTIVLSFVMALSGCVGKPAPTPTPEPDPKPDPVAPVVTSIEFSKTDTSIGAGALVIAAKCLPADADQGYTVKLNAPVMGVKLDDKTLTVHQGANTGDVVSLTVTSTSDTAKTVTKDFTLNIAEPTDYVSITDANGLKAMGTSAGAAKNYKLGGDITLEIPATGESEARPMIWSPLATPFTGLFDGAGFTIKGINIPRTSAASKGFFSVNDGVIRNVGFDNSAYVDQYMNMGANSGVVAGINNGGIKNIFTNVPLATSSGTAGALVGTNNGYIINSYAMGATVTNGKGAEKAGVVGINNGTIIGTVADKNATELTSFVGSELGQGDAALNAKLLDAEALQTEKTYTDMAWSIDSWYFANVYPILVNEDFASSNIKKAIEITTPNVIEIGDLPWQRTLQLNADKVNARTETLTWEIDTAVEGISIDAATGVLTFAKGAVLDGKILDITATFAVNAGSKKVEGAKSFTIYDDGYTSAKGIVIQDEEQLYNTLIVKSDKSNIEQVKRNINRTIRLGNDIKLSTYKRWPGVDKFYGTFDGQGFTISGLDVLINTSNTFTIIGVDGNSTTYDGNAGWGFFRRLGDKVTNRTGTVKNVMLKEGKIVKQLYTTDTGDKRYIGGLVQYFECGLIKDVLVDLTITSHTNWNGMIVGLMTGSHRTDRARMQGSARIESSIAMGKMSSSLAMVIDDKSESVPRKTYAPFANGAVIAKTENPGSEIINCYAMGAKGEDINLTNRTDVNILENVSKIDNFAFKTVEECLIADTFRNHGFSENSWFLENDYYPTLKGFNRPEVAAAIVKITNARVAEYNYIDIKDGVQITTETSNAKGRTVTYALDKAVAGVAISSTGLITVTNEVADSSTITVNVTLGEGTVGDTYSFNIVNDGYTEEGYTISNADELYNMLIVKEDKSNEIVVARNMSRYFKLTANIALTGEQAKWPGVAATFSGHFDGQGYTISGINVDNTIATDGYGFFKKIKAESVDNISVENLVLKGSVVGKGLYVAGLAKEFYGGTIKNVLVDMSVDSDTHRVGKIVGAMNENTRIEHSIGMGHIGTTLEYSKPADGTNRPTWGPYAAGAFMGIANDTKYYTIDENLAFRNVGDNAKDIGFTNRRGYEIGSEGGAGKLTKSEILPYIESMLAITYTAKNFDPAIWFFEDGYMPTLRNADFVKPGAAPVFVNITNTEEEYTFKDLTEGKIQIKTEQANNTAETPITYSLKEAVAGVTIDATTGLVTLTDEVVHESMVTVLAKIGTVATATYKFKVNNDKSGPVIVSTADELYNALIKNGTNDEQVTKNLAGKIQLSADIVLSGAQANWPGVAGSFTGHFNGNGHTISGLNVQKVETETTKNTGYGFFMKVAGDAVIEKLVLRGDISCEVLVWANNEDNFNYVAGLVCTLDGGVVKNVLVDVNIKTNAEWNGKIAGRMNGGTIESTIAMGTMGSLENTSASTGVRRDWAKYKFGAFVGNVKEGANILKNCYANGVESTTNTTEATTDSKVMVRLLGFSNRAGSAGGNGTNTRVGFKTDAQLKVATPLTGFDATIWSFTAENYPTLKVVAIV